MKRIGMVLIILLFVMGCSNKYKQDEQLNNQSQENKKKESAIVNKNVSHIYDFKPIIEQTQKYLENDNLYFLKVKIKDRGPLSYEIEVADETYEYKIKFDEEFNVIKEKREHLDFEDQQEVDRESFVLEDLNQLLTLDDVIDTHQNLIKDDIINYQVKKDHGVLEYEIETHQTEYIFNANNGELIEIDN